MSQNTTTTNQGQQQQPQQGYYSYGQTPIQHYQQPYGNTGVYAMGGQMQVQGGVGSNSSGVKGGCYVRLLGLPFTANKGDVKSFLQPIQVNDDDIHLISSDDGRPSGFAFVRVPEENLNSVLAKHREYLGKRYVEISKVATEEVQWHLRTGSGQNGFYSQNNDYRNPQQQYAQYQQYQSNQLQNNRYFAGAAGQSYPAQYSAYGARNQQQQKDCYYVKLRGLPYSASLEEVKEFLKGLNYTDIVLGKPQYPNSYNNGHAIVQLASTEDVNELKALDRKSMGSRYIEIMTASSDDFYEHKRHQDPSNRNSSMQNTTYQQTNGFYSYPMAQQYFQNRPNQC